MQNFYILLKLPFDPPEEDTDKINKAIDDKIKQWQNESKNPRKAIKAKENLAQIPKIKEVMLDPDKRRVESKAAKELKDAKSVDISYEVMILSPKGYILLDEVNEIINKYSEYGFTRDDIESLSQVPIVEKKTEEEKLEVIDDNIISQLETYFSNLGIDDLSLYNLIDIEDGDNIIEYRKKADAFLNKLLQKGDKLNEDELYQKLGGLAKIIFATEEDIIKYNNFLKGKRFLKLNNFIKNAAISNNNIISGEVYDIIFQIAKREYNMDDDWIFEYVTTNAMIDGIQIDIDSIKNRKASVPLINLDKNNNDEEDEPEQEEINFPETKNEQFDNSVPEQPTEDETYTNTFGENTIDIEADKLNENLIKPTAEFLNTHLPDIGTFIEEAEFYENQNQQGLLYPSAILSGFYTLETAIVVLLNMIFSIQYQFMFKQSLLLIFFVLTLLSFEELLRNLVISSRVKTIHKNLELLYSYWDYYKEMVEEDFNKHEVDFDDYMKNPQSVYDYYNQLGKKAAFIVNKSMLIKNKTVKLMKSFRSQFDTNSRMMMYKIGGIAGVEILIIFIVFFL